MSEAQPNPPAEPTDPGLEAEVDAVIEACGGEPRAAVRALLVANAFLEAQVEEAVGSLSSGFVRAKLQSKKRRGGNKGGDV